jgi:GntR family transcriptional regulator
MTGPRFASVAAELRERISLGDYARSGALESEADLGQRFGVSRVTIRRALEQLRDEGLITARRGSGWYVATGAAFGQALALGSFQHATSAVAEAGVRLTRRITEYGYQPAPLDTAHLLGVDDGTEVLRVRAVRHTGGHPLDVVTEWVPLAYATPVSRADAAEPGVWETLRRHGRVVDVVRQSIAASAATESIAPLLDTTPARRSRSSGGWPAADGQLPPCPSTATRSMVRRRRARGWPGNATAEPPGVIAVHQST